MSHTKNAFTPLHSGLIKKESDQNIISFDSNTTLTTKMDHPQERNAMGLGVTLNPDDFPVELPDTLVIKILRHSVPTYDFMQFAKVRGENGSTRPWNNGMPFSDITHFDLNNLGTFIHDRGLLRRTADENAR